MLHTESTVLKEGLSEFSIWTRQKIQLFEEDMDIFKVVYSLHASLSQVNMKTYVYRQYNYYSEMDNINFLGEGNVE